MEKEKNSLAWEMLKTLKAVIGILSVIAIIELCIIARLGYLLYDSQFDYETNDTIQDVSETNLDNSSITQY